MKHRIGLCVPGGSFMPQDTHKITTPYDNCIAGYEVCANCGFDFAEATFPLIMSLSEEEAERARNAGVQYAAANCFLPGQYALAKTDLPVLKEYVKSAFDRAEHFGIKIVVFGSGGARRMPDDISGDEKLRLLDKYILFIRSCGELAAPHGITFALEPLNPKETNFMTDEIEGYEIVKKAAHPNVRLLADAYHIGVKGEPVSDLDIVKDVLVHVHVSETDRKWPGAYDGDPEKGGYLRAFADKLNEIGYDGRVSCECVYKDFVGETPDILKYMREVF